MKGFKMLINACRNNLQKVCTIISVVFFNLIIPIPFIADGMWMVAALIFCMEMIITPSFISGLLKIDKDILDE